MSNLNEAVEEIAREIRVRAAIYPKLVANGKLSQAEADRRINAMGNGLAALLEIQKSQRLNGGDR